MRPLAPSILLFAGSAALFLAGLGRLPLFGRDEALYAEAGREMVATGDWITPRVNGGPFFEKPPLYYWLAAVSYRLLGVSPFAARLPAALLAVLTVMLTARIGGRAWGQRAGLLAGLALATSLQMAVIGRMGIMDVPLTCLALLALLAYERWRSGGALSGAAAFGACIGLGVLLKGAAGLVPVVVAIADASWRVLRSPRGRGPHSAALAIGSVLLAAAIAIGIAAPWFLAMSARHGQAFGSTLLLREHLRRVLEPMQGHGGPIWYYLPLIAVGFFPWVVFLPAAMVRRADQGLPTAFWRPLCIIWTLTVLAGFSLASTKLPGYITPLFPPMALLVGAELDRRLAQPGRAPWIALAAGAAVLAVLVSLLPTAARRLGAPVGAAEEAGLLVIPVVVWVIGLADIAVGALYGLRGRLRPALAAVATGQVAILLSVLAGILPVLSPYLGGGVARLALVAARELPHSQLVLYETNPETVCFVLRRSVLTFGRREQHQLMEQLASGPVALIAPVKDRALWEQLPSCRQWRAGSHVLLEIPGRAGPASTRLERATPRSPKAGIRENSPRVECTDMTSERRNPLPPGVC